MRNWDVRWYTVVVFICLSLINGVKKILLESFLHAMSRKVLFQKKVMHIKVTPGTCIGFLTVLIALTFY